LLICPPTEALKTKFPYHSLYRRAFSAQANRIDFIADFSVSDVHNILSARMAVRADFVFSKSSRADSIGEASC
jgi:hypothetical protein